MPVPRGAREEADARPDGVGEAPSALVIDSDSASDNNPSVATGGRRYRSSTFTQTAGISSRVTSRYYLEDSMLCFQNIFCLY